MFFWENLSALLSNVTLGLLFLDPFYVIFLSISLFENVGVTLVSSYTEFLPDLCILIVTI